MIKMSRLIKSLIALLVVTVMMISPSGWAKDGLFRLFTTPQERAALNAERSKPPPTPPKTDKGTSISPKLPNTITLNGLIIRSQGPTTVWINGKNEIYQPGFKVEIDQREGIRVPISLQLSQSQRIVSLKPGQTINTLDGKVKESFQNNGEF
jgi:hypothetical protein